MNWYKNKGSEGDIVLSTRVRLARNYKNFPFTSKMSEADAKKIVEIKNLSHVYMPGSPFEVRAVDDVSFDVRDGEFFGIIGHTGSGKSTLIQHLNGLLLPTGGSVKVNGYEIEKSAIAILYRTPIILRCSSAV